VSEEDQIRFIKHMDSLTGEAFLVGLFRRGIGTKLEAVLFDGTGIPLEGVTYQFEFPVPRGRADIVMFHLDGTATVIEVKDGSSGLQSVLAGIGQVTCYAVQIGMSRGMTKAVRKVLAFSRMRLDDEDLVSASCLKAGVIPIELGNAAALKEVSIEHIKGVENASTQ